MFTLVTILLIFASLLLIGVVLLQPGKGDLSPTFGGLGTQFGTMFGAQRTMDFLQKTTRALIIGILLLSLIANKFLLKPSVQNELKPVTQGAPIPKTMPNTPPPVEVPKK